MIIKIVLISLVLIVTFQSSLFNLVKLTQTTDALCLDGSPGAYYISEGSGINSTKFVIWFDGAAWCGEEDLASTLQSCYQRSFGIYGSSKTYAETVNLNNSGVLSGQATVNPAFYDWNRVLLKYCDGTGHQGTKSQPVNYKATNLYFRGQNVTIGQFNSIDKSHKLFTQATQILLTGGSAGGLATYHWTNWVADNTKAKVWSAPDSGIFLDVVNVNNKQFAYRNQFINFMKLSNVEVNQPVPECHQKYSDQPWRCMFAQNLWQFIKVPLFPINPLYDSWSIPNILGIRCLSGQSLQNCNIDQRNYIEQYRINTTKVLNAIINSNPRNGAWAAACADHAYVTYSRWTSNNFRVPQHSTYSISFSVINWILGIDQPQNHRHIDEVVWPENSPCSGVVAAVRFQ